MYQGLVHAHSGLRWLVLILLIAAIIKAVGAVRAGRAYPGKDGIVLGAFVVTHIQLLIGLVLYFISPKVSGDISNDIVRFYAVEHMVGMLLAIAVITVGYIRAKKQATLPGGWKTIAIFYGIGLVIILASIPWPFRIAGAGWF